MADSKIDNGGSAFPVAVNPDFKFAHDGMSLRDWFAGQALAGITAGLCSDASHGNRAYDRVGFSHAAQDAYTMADAMIAARDEAGWQPIESAPKDGSDVLLSSPHWHGDVVVGCWSFEGWRDREDSDKLEPTHWMPLPAAPENAEGRS